MKTYQEALLIAVENHLKNPSGGLIAWVTATAQIELLSQLYGQPGSNVSADYHLKINELTESNQSKARATRRQADRDNNKERRNVL